MKKTSRRFLINLLLPILLVIGSVFIAKKIIASRPKPPKQEKVSAAPKVDTITPTNRVERPVIVAHGIVQPAKDVQLQPQVGGRVVEISDQLIVGGLFSKDDVLLQIEKRDYELAVQERSASLVQAEFQVLEEQGRQIVAKQEWTLLGDSVPQSGLGKQLALREPHLKQKESAKMATESALERAKLDLERTTIRAPFNAVVLMESVELGQQISPQNPIARLVGTDELHAVLNISYTLLSAIRIRRGEAPGSPVRIRQGHTERTGEVIRILGDMDTESRMARVVVTIQDPLGLKNPTLKEQPILVGAYVTGEIEGPEMPNALALPRTALREGDSIWVKTPDNTLEIRNIEIAFRRDDSVVVSGGLKPGEAVITSPLPYAVDGMDVQ